MSSATATNQRASNAGKRDYGYSNARIRGMRSKLLRAGALDRLMDAPDMHQLIQELLQTEYASDLEEALIKGRGAGEISEALKHNLVRTYRKVFGFLNEEARDICGTCSGAGTCSTSRRSCAESTCTCRRQRYPRACCR